MAQFGDYAGRFRSFRMERTADGILTVALTTDGGPHVHTGEAHTEFAEAFAAIAADDANEVVVLTGTGGTWIDAIDFSTVGDITRPEGWHRILSEARRTFAGLLDIQVPVIAAVPGPATVHAEYALTADIVLASTTAVFQDNQHLPVGVVPADGVQVMWSHVLGPHRARYFLLTGQRLSAEEALQLGAVHEVLPPERLDERAGELARQLLRLPPLTRRYTRLMLTKALKARALDLPFDMGLEGLSAAANPALVRTMRGTGP